MPLAEHDIDLYSYSDGKLVSIHVPLAEHDLGKSAELTAENLVSIHVPLAEHDEADVMNVVKYLVSIHVPLAEHDEAVLHAAFGG